ncbi:cytochrome c maturation protein CcmE [Ahrensia sp. R2A130]|uniref:cytochrome c maturation protein CcmE n=1 Tax=Ahrensia sp. R2A130 TaxID=744979 RepID=UPI00058B2D7B|nr:cytochrome c maturation protein CcmE [Ahrensia sp. R2A130]
MTRRTNRLIWIGVIGIVLAGAVGLSMFALREGISFALSPSELKAASVGPKQKVRLFGLVEEGSVNRGNGLDVSFVLTDTDETIKVSYTNILPDLFREGQGIITEGVLGADGTFMADTVLAKHDENYMPEGMAEKLKEKGVWKEAAK